MEDTHFLERLQRVGWRETELALRLYREPELVRLLLDDAGAPSAQRIAIAISEAPEPPHVIVTREGAFVTCLGAGMKVGDLPVVGKHRIERAADRHEQMKGRIAYIDWAVENSRSVKRMWRSVFSDGHRVPREVMVGLAPLVPLLERDLIDWWIDEDKIARRLVYDNTNRFAKPRARLTSNDEEQLFRIWRSHWSAAHLIGLFGLADHESLDLLGQALMLPNAPPGPFAFQAMRFGFWPTTLRGAWTLARIGSGALRSCKRLLQTPRESALIIDKLAATVGIAFVGAAHSPLRAEAEKALWHGAPDEDPRPYHNFLTTYRRFWSKAVSSEVLRDRAQALRIVDELGKRIAQDERVEYGPDYAELLRFHSANRFTNVFTGTAWIDLAGLLSWFARAELFDFYLPERLLVGAPEWVPQDTINLIRGTVGFGTYIKPAPQPKAPKVGRNEPCKCGSGKKSKRCCAA